MKANDESKEAETDLIVMKRLSIGKIYYELKSNLDEQNQSVVNFIELGFSTKKKF